MVTLRNMMTLSDIAEDLGVKYETAVVYHSRGTLPAADEHVGHSPLWKRTTYTRWKNNRPGRGAGGGRKTRSN